MTEEAPRLSPSVAPSEQLVKCYMWRHKPRSAKYQTRSLARCRTPRHRDRLLSSPLLSSPLLSFLLLSSSLSPLFSSPFLSPPLPSSLLSSHAQTSVCQIPNSIASTVSHAQAPGSSPLLSSPLLSSPFSFLLLSSSLSSPFLSPPLLSFPLLSFPLLSSHSQTSVCQIPNSIASTVSHAQAPGSSPLLSPFPSSSLLSLLSSPLLSLTNLGLPNTKLDR